MNKIDLGKLTLKKFVIIFVILSGILFSIPWCRDFYGLKVLLAICFLFLFVATGYAQRKYVSNDEKYWDLLKFLAIGFTFLVVYASVIKYYDVVAKKTPPAFISVCIITGAFIVAHYVDKYRESEKRSDDRHGLGSGHLSKRLPKPE